MRIFLEKTMDLRWVEADPEDLNDEIVPLAFIPGLPENGPTLYKLQQFWRSTNYQVKSEWRDIEKG